MRVKHESFAKQNKGSALIAVLIILTFVSVVALIITKITITNIEMKELQSSTQKNFYNTEDIMDMLKSGLSKELANVVKESYADVLENYSLYTSEGKNLQEQFENEYLKKLENKFGTTEGTNTSTDEIYTTAKYDIDVVKNSIEQENKRIYFKTSESEAVYDLDYKNGVFILKNIKVAYEESSGYETQIKTDIVFEAPEMAFGNSVKNAEFMKYALIADDMVDIRADNINIWKCICWC